MAVHELGHAIGAVVSGGSVQRVVLHPLAISRTDVSPNPRPGFVVWMGPVVGCLIPLALAALIPIRFASIRNIAKFFAGFCLIANGAYIALGSFDRVGDCEVMLASGAPPWILVMFGATTVPLGLCVWHRMGSLGEFLRQPQLVGHRLANTITVLLVVLLVTELWLY